MANNIDATIYSNLLAAPHYLIHLGSLRGWVEVYLDTPYTSYMQHQRGLFTIVAALGFPGDIPSVLGNSTAESMFISAEYYACIHFDRFTAFIRSHVVQQRLNGITL